MPAVVVDDAALLVPAAGLGHGIGVVAGTGSIAVGTDTDGAVLVWSGRLGLGARRRGQRARDRPRGDPGALAAHDAGRPDDGLLAALLAHYGDPDPQARARTVNDPSTPERWGPAAPAVFRAADDGSALAVRVVDEAAAQLAHLVSRLVARGATGGAAVAAGSVIVRQPRLSAALRQRLARTEPGLVLHVLDVAPVAGAVAPARRRLCGA